MHCCTTTRVVFVLRDARVGAQKGLWRVEVKQEQRCAGFVVLLGAVSVQSFALILERKHNVHRGDSFAVCMCCVHNSVLEHSLQKTFESAARFIVDHVVDALDAAAPRQTANRRLGDSLNVVSHHCARTFGTLYSASRHYSFVWLASRSILLYSGSARFFVRPPNASKLFRLQSRCFAERRTLADRRSKLIAEPKKVVVALLIKVSCDGLRQR